MRRITHTCLLGFPVWAGNGGPLGIDHRLTYDDHGIGNRKVQVDLERAVVFTLDMGPGLASRL